MNQKYAVSFRQACSFLSARHLHLSACTKLYFLVTEAQVCERLSQSHYVNLNGWESTLQYLDCRCDILATTSTQPRNKNTILVFTYCCGYSMLTLVMWYSEACGYWQITKWQYYCKCFKMYVFIPHNYILFIICDRHHLFCWCWTFSMDFPIEIS